MVLRDTLALLIFIWLHWLHYWTTRLAHHYQGLCIFVKNKNHVIYLCEKLIASMVVCKKDQETLSYAFSKFNNMITNSCLLSLAHAIAFIANNTLLKMVTSLIKLVCERRIQFYMYFFILLAQSFKLMLTKILGGNWEAKFYPPPWKVEPPCRCWKLGTIPSRFLVASFVQIERRCSHCKIFQWESFED